MLQNHFKKDRLLTLVVLALFSCSQEKSIEIPNYTAEQFSNNYRISGGRFSKDGKKLIYTNNETGKSAAYVYDIAKDSSYIGLKNDTYDIYSLVLAPNGIDYVYATDKGQGFQYAKIFITDGNSETNLAPGDKNRTLYRGLKKDYSGIYFSSNSRNPRSSDLYEYNFETGESRMLWQQEGNYRHGDISPDHRYLVLYESITEDIIDLYLLNLETKEKIRISPENNSDMYFGLDFSNDGNSLYFMTNQGSEFRYLAKYAISTQTIEKVYESNWDVMSADLSPDESFIAINTNRNGRPTTTIVDRSSNKPISLSFLEENQIVKTTFSPTGEHILFQVSNPTRPQELWLVNLGNGKATRIANALNPELKEEHLSVPEDVSFQSYDGLEIPAFLFKPKGDKSSSYPALVWTHGGPGGQFRKTYNEQIQYVVNQGYVVLAVNNRGSSGYGKTFKGLDDQKHGVDDLKDVLQGKKYLQSLNYVDENNIGIIGDSYGGYLVLAALAFHPDAFQAGIDMFGISNWLHVLNSMPDYWTQRRQALFAEMGHPVEDSIMLSNKSPLFHSEKITAPLFVIQGAKDSRVPQSESDQIVNAVKQNGVEVEYLLFEDEGHGIRKRENRLNALNQIVTFLDKHLKK